LARLLGIDPGTVKVGWGVVETHGARVMLLACGVIKAPAKAPLPERLTVIFAGLEALIVQYRPERSAIEETFAGNNPKSAIAMGEGRGVALLALARAKLPVLELSPAEIKKAVTGQGGAGKDLVAKMVCARLNLAEIPASQDATDALAIALALAHRTPLVQAR